jgi:hypothetical protein
MREREVQGEPGVHIRTRRASCGSCRELRDSDRLRPCDSHVDAEVLRGHAVLRDSPFSPEDTRRPRVGQERCKMNYVAEKAFDRIAADPNLTLTSWWSTSCAAKTLVS